MKLGLDDFNPQDLFSLNLISNSAINYLYETKLLGSSSCKTPIQKRYDLILDDSFKVLDQNDHVITFKHKKCRVPIVDYCIKYSSADWLVLDTTNCTPGTRARLIKYIIKNSRALVYEDPIIRTSAKYFKYVEIYYNKRIVFNCKHKLIKIF